MKIFTVILLILVVAYFIWQVCLLVKDIKAKNKRKKEKEINKE